MTPIPHASRWWRLNSIQIAAVWSVLGGAIIAAWPVASWFLDRALPDGPLRIAAGAVVTAVTLGSFFYARLRPQPKLASSSAAIGRKETPASSSAAVGRKGTPASSSAAIGNQNAE